MRIVIYYNHYNTMGHSTRVMALVKAIRRFIPKSRVLVFEGGKTPSLLPLSRLATVIPLPHSIDKRGLFIEEAESIYQRMVASGQLDRMLKERFHVMRRALLRFRPDIFITEYFPFGQEFWTFEVPHLLEFVKERFDCRIVSSAGYLCYTTGAYGHIRRFYDALLVHSPEGFSKAHVRRMHPEGKRQLDRILKDFSGKIHFTSFVCDILPPRGVVALRRRILGKRFKRIVFVSRGGGIVNREIILSSILASKRMPETFFVICPGPSSDKGDLAAFQKLARGLANVDLIPALLPGQFDRYMAAADACVAMSGYNTALKLLYFNKPVVLVPYYTPEQKWRAELLGEFLPSVYLQDRDATAAAMERSLRKVLAMRPGISRVSPEWFNGGRQSAALLRAL